MKKVKLPQPFSLLTLLETVLSTLLIFESSHIGGYSGPLVKSIWVNGFIQLNLIYLYSLPFHSVKIWLDILEQDTPYKVWSWNFNYSKGGVMIIQHVMLCQAQTTEVSKSWLIMKPFESQIQGKTSKFFFL